jgi:hypothetical protein
MGLATIWPSVTGLALLVERIDALVLVTRGDLDAIEGPRFDKALGPTARTITKRNRVAVFAVKCDGRPETLYRRVAHCIPPNLVEDFIVLNLGEDAAGMRPGLCPLADWLARPADVDPERCSTCRAASSALTLTVTARADRVAGRPGATGIPDRRRPERLGRYRGQPALHGRPRAPTRAPRSFRAL